MSADRCPVCDDISDHGPGEVACLRRAQVRRDDDLLTRCLAAEAARDEATRRLAEEKATVAAQSLDLFGALDAQAEATRRLAVVEEAVRVARKSIGVLVDHFEAMGGEEDSSQLAYDLQAISDGLRAALEKQP